jgi:hypothetical protein
MANPYEAACDRVSMRMYLEAMAAIRVCVVPGCDCVLGDDVEGDRCGMHRGRKCARKGCDRDQLGGSIWCQAHAACAASVSCDSVSAVEDPANELGRECNCCHVGQPCSCCSLHAIPEEAEQPNDKQPFASPVGSRADVEPTPWHAETLCKKHDEYKPCRGCELEAADTAGPAIAGAMEVAWAALADDPNLDPRTVATCKRLRDMEVRL